MIYKKNSSFPHPVLCYDNNSYVNSEFSFLVDIFEAEKYYTFKFKTILKSEYIKSLLLDKSARLVVVIQDIDSKYYTITSSKPLVIDKSRINLSDKCVMQMFVISKKKISFKYNNELSNIYDKYKDEIIVGPHSILAISSKNVFDGNIKKPYDLFEKRIDEKIRSEIKIDLGNECIVINYKNSDMQFQEIANNEILNYSYVYMGLQKAIYAFINDYRSTYEDNFVDLNKIDISELKPLYSKLYSLITSNEIYLLEYEDTDYVISRISDNIIYKHQNYIRRLINNGWFKIT